MWSKEQVEECSKKVLNNFEMQLELLKAKAEESNNCKMKLDFSYGIENNNLYVDELKIGDIFELCAFKFDGDCSIEYKYKDKNYCMMFDYIQLFKLESDKIKFMEVLSQR